MWRYLEEKRTPNLANVMAINLFGQLLYREKMKVNGRPQCLDFPWFSLTMTDNDSQGSSPVRVPK